MSGSFGDKLVPCCIGKFVVQGCTNAGGGVQVGLLFVMCVSGVLLPWRASYFGGQKFFLTCFYARQFWH